MQLSGWQMAEMAAAPANVGVIVLELAGMVVGVVETYSSVSPVMGLPLVSSTVAERGRGLFWLTVTGVDPLTPGAVSAIEAGGQVEKNPAELDELDVLALMRTEPGFCAVATPF